MQYKKILKDIILQEFDTKKIVIFNLSKLTVLSQKNSVSISSLHRKILRLKKRGVILKVGKHTYEKADESLWLVK